MRILVVGGTRGIGRQCVLQAHERGHAARVFARRPPRNAALRGVSADGSTEVHMRVGDMRVGDVRVGDVRDASRVASAVAGQDAVIVTIGMQPTLRDVRLFSSAISNVIAAMQQAGVARVMYVTGVGAGDSFGHGGFWYDSVLRPLLLNRIYEDKDRSEAILRTSPLAWTIVRPALLTNGPTTARYRIFNDLNHIVAGRISRGDVAHFILDELERNEFAGRTPLLTY